MKHCAGVNCILRNLSGRVSLPVQFIFLPRSGTPIERHELMYVLPGGMKVGWGKIQQDTFHGEVVGYVNMQPVFCRGLHVEACADKMPRVRGGTQPPESTESSTENIGKNPAG